MKAFLITAPVFTGAVQVVYNDEGVLVQLDFTGTNMDTGMVALFKSKVAAHVDGLGPAFDNRVTIVETDYKVSFDDFWERYSQKHNRDRCLKLWDKLKAVDQVKAFFGLAAYERHLQKNPWKSKADPGYLFAATLLGE